MTEWASFGLSSAGKRLSRSQWYRVVSGSGCNVVEPERQLGGRISETDGENAEHVSRNDSVMNEEQCVRKTD